MSAVEPNPRSLDSGQCGEGAAEVRGDGACRLIRRLTKEVARRVAKRMALLALLPVVGCAAPPLRTYILTGLSQPIANAASIQRSERPILLVRHVAIPDHLDTHDMVVRTGPNQLRSSRTGRWGDRLSVAVTDVLTEDLQATMPGTEVIKLPPSTLDFSRLSTEISHFEIDEDGTLRLTARWNLSIVKSDGDIEPSADGGEIILSKEHVPSGDAAEAFAMSEMLSRLADRLATHLGGNTGGSRCCGSYTAASK